MATDHADSAFTVRGVSKVFSSRSGPVRALTDISMDVAEGSFTCIVGPSGCGKSTLLRILGGLETATVGEVEVTVPGTRVPDAAFVFQEHGVFPWFTALENVAFGQRMAGVAKAQRTTAARRWIAEVGLSGFEDAYPHQLSGGMRQRIAIARAWPRPFEWWSFASLR